MEGWDGMSDSIIHPGTENNWIIETPTEKANRIGVPVIPKRKPVNPNGIIGVCGECGMSLTKVMGYVCYHPNCPCFPRVTC